MSALTEDGLRDGTFKTESAPKTGYDDRVVYWALGGVAALTPVLLIVVLLTMPGTDLLTDLWLAFGGANLIVWSIVLVAGLTQTLLKAWHGAKSARQAVQRRLAIRPQTTEPDRVEAAAA